MGKLQEAAKKGDLSEVQRLLDGGFLRSRIPVDHYDAASEYFTAAYWAAFNQHTETVKYLVEQCNANPADALAGAIKRGNVNLIEYLITERKVNLNNAKAAGHNHTPLLMITACDGQLDMMKLLTEKYKARVTNEVWSWVIPKGFLEMAKYLIEKHNCFPSEKTIDSYQRFLDGKNWFPAPTPDKGRVRSILSYVYPMAAKKGNVDAQVQMAREANQKNDYKTAHFWGQKAAEQNSADGQAILGCLYRYGHGVGQDYLIADEWFRKAAAQGHSGARIHLSEIEDDVEKAQRTAELRKREEAEAKKAREQAELNENLKKFMAMQAQTTHSSNTTARPTEINDGINSLGQISLSLEIPYNQLILGEKIGQGGFGIVYRATWQQSDAAVKQLTSNGLSEDALEEFKREASVMAKLRNPHIIQLYGICITQPYCLVMEYASKGSLHAVLHSDKQMDWPTRLEIAQGIARGLVYLHNQNPMILHRDIKSMNVLLDKSMTPKLTDFGLAKVKDTTTATTGSVAGTLQWMAPELLDGENTNYTTACDVYSLGVLFWEIASRKLPYQGKNRTQILSLALQNKREAIPADCPPKFGALVIHCWDHEANKRPTVKKVIEGLTDAATTDSNYMSLS